MLLLFGLLRGEKEIKVNNYLTNNNNNNNNNIKV